MIQSNRMKYTGRKLFHLLGGIGLLSLYYIFGRNEALFLYGVLAVLVLLLEIARLKIPALNQFLYGHFESFIRKNEGKKLTGTIPYILGVGISLLVYSPEVASTAICFLAFGDVAATTIGERFGMTKIGNKSLEGTGAFIVAAIMAGFLLIPFGLALKVWVMILGAFIAAGVELMPLSINDNLAVPILSGAAMELMLKITQ
jgi:dolichol kinase